MQGEEECGGPGVRWHHPCFTEEETEAQKGPDTQEHNRSGWALDQDSQGQALDPEVCLLSERMNDAGSK